MMSSRPLIAADSEIEIYSISYFFFICYSMFTIGMTSYFSTERGSSANLSVFIMSVSDS